MLLIRKALIYKVIMWAVFFLIASADTIRLSVHAIRLSADNLIVFLNNSYKAIGPLVFVIITTAVLQKEWERGTIAISGGCCKNRKNH